MTTIQQLYRFLVCVIYKQTKKNRTDDSIRPFWKVGILSKFN